jgi:hypothetical protein
MLAPADKRLIRDAAARALGVSPAARGKHNARQLPKGTRCVAWFFDGKKVRQCLRKAFDEDEPSTCLKERVEEGYWYCNEHASKGEMFANTQYDENLSRPAK